MKVIDLFSGIGGFSLGLESTGGFETVQFVENNKWCQKVLAKNFPNVPITGDIKNYEPRRSERIGLVCGGFPCQPFSVAGKRKGTEDDRHLWPEMLRVIKASKPRWVIGENVRNLTSIQEGMVFEQVCTDLENEGYEVQSFIIPASAVNAPHQRYRVWIVANTKCDGLTSTKKPRSTKETIRQESQGENRTLDSQGASCLSETTRNVADSDSGLCRGGRAIEPSGENKDRELYSSQEEQTRKHLRSKTVRCNSVRGETENVENSDNNGQQGRFFETCDQTFARQRSKIIRRNGANMFGGSGNDGRNYTESTVDGEIQRPCNGNKTESTEPRSVCGVSEESNNDKNTLGENRHQENHDRTLVQEGQIRVQSSLNRGLGEDKTTFKRNKIQSGDDTDPRNRVETTKNVANANNEGFRTCIRRSDDDDAKESRSRGTDGERSTSDDERHNTTSTTNETMDVANSYNTGDRTPKYDTKREGEKINKRREGLAQSESSRLSKDVPYSEKQGLEGYGESCGKKLREEYSARERSEEQQRGMDHERFSFEPGVGRVAHGISHRVDRLKGLGNAIVPQIAYQIGLAILEAEDEHNKVD